jgi:hypothetical protein
MFTYSTNLRGAITATLNTVGGTALLDDEEEKVNNFHFVKIHFDVFCK